MGEVFHAPWGCPATKTTTKGRRVLLLVWLEIICARA